MALSMQVENVQVEASSTPMEGTLWLPEDPIGAILFAHIGGHNRIKPPSDYVACVLRNARLATLWVDLLTSQEARKRELQSDVALLAGRMNAACDWLRQHPMTRDLPIGLFVSDSGAAAALQLAAELGCGIAAIVSRGGRPDQATQGTFGKIRAPTLLIVGGLDDGVVQLNRSAYAALRCKKRIEIIPGATQTFEETGNPEVIARLARRWFVRYSSMVERRV